MDSGHRIELPSFIQSNGTIQQSQPISAHRDLSVLYSLFTRAPFLGLFFSPNNQTLTMPPQAGDPPEGRTRPCSTKSKAESCIWKQNMLHCRIHAQQRWSWFWASVFLKDRQYSCFKLQSFHEHYFWAPYLNSHNTIAERAFAFHKPTQVSFPPSHMVLQAPWGVIPITDRSKPGA